MLNTLALQYGMSCYAILFTQIISIYLGFNSVPTLVDDYSFKLKFDNPPNNQNTPIIDFVYSILQVQSPVLVGYIRQYHYSINIKVHLGML